MFPVSKNRGLKKKKGVENVMSQKKPIKKSKGEKS